MTRLMLFLSAVTVLAGKPAAPVRDESVAEFWRQAALDELISLEKLDRTLLARAIFHESNRVRAELALPVLRPEPLLDRAAELEAEVGRASHPPSHTNPFPLIGTPAERVQYVGLKAARVAENIALISIYDTGPEQTVGIVIREGKQLFINPRTREELKPASYRLFAKTVVQAWMDSPGHRANLVNPALTHLGCGAVPTTDLNGVQKLFSVQLFFTPVKK